MGDPTPSPEPPPSSAQGLLWIALIVLGIAVIAFFLLGDAWSRWFPTGE